MTQTDLVLTAGTALVALLLALAVLLATAYTRRRGVARTVDHLTENATTGQIDTLLHAIRTDDEEQDR